MKNSQSIYRDTRIGFTSGPSQFVIDGGNCVLSANWKPIWKRLLLIKINLKTLKVMSFKIVVLEIVSNGSTLRNSYNIQNLVK